MGRGLSPMQKELLLLTEAPGIRTFQSACAYFCDGKGLSESWARCPASNLQAMAFGGDPDAKRMLSIRAAVCRSLARLESRGLVVRNAAGDFTSTLDGAIDVAVEKISVNEDSLTVRQVGPVNLKEEVLPA